MVFRVFATIAAIVYMIVALICIMTPVVSSITSVLLATLLAVSNGYSEVRAIIITIALITTIARISMIVLRGLGACGIYWVLALGL